MRIRLINNWFTPYNHLLEPGVHEVDDDLRDQLPPSAQDADTGELLNPTDPKDRKPTVKAPVDASDTKDDDKKPETTKAKGTSAL